jgi:hypothetical protein
MKPTAVSSLLMNGADGISDIEGKATRVGASERGQRTSFNDSLLAAWPDPKENSNKERTMIP